jgi:nicotinamidase-related amidase
VPAKNRDQPGHAPPHTGAALLLIDVVNHFDYPGGRALARHALPMARRLAALKRRARRAGIPAIYVNDNFGRWRSDFRALVEHCRAEGARSRPVVELLAPADDDYFVLKPKHSGFFATALETLLHYLGAETLILTGLTAERCVFFTASDGFLRDFRIFVPRDCVVSIDPRERSRALHRMTTLLDADVRSSARLDLGGLARRGSPRPKRAAAGRPP